MAAQFCNFNAYSPPSVSPRACVAANEIRLRDDIFFFATRTQDVAMIQRYFACRNNDKSSHAAPQNVL